MVQQQQRPASPQRTSSRESPRRSRAPERAPSNRARMAHLGEFNAATRLTSDRRQLIRQLSDDHLSVAASDWNEPDLDSPMEELCELYREAKQIEDMTRSDITGLRTWRIIVILVMLLTYIGATTGTFLILRSEQQDDTEERYVLFTHTINETCGRQIARFRHAMSSLSHSVTTAGLLSSPSTFPLVHVPLFETMALQAQKNARVEVIAWSPLVTNRAAWSNYSSTHRDWYTESRAAFAASTENDHWDYLSFHSKTWPTDIWSVNATNVTASDVAFPIWHVSPPQFAPHLVNYNLHAEGYMANLLPVLSQAADGVLSAVNPPDDMLHAIMQRSTGDSEANHAFYASDESITTQSQHPHAWYLQPVFAELYNRSSALVGFLTVVVPFDGWLHNLLPEGIQGIDIVLRNNCGQAYTYHLNGPEPEYVGEGDSHDPKFDDTEIIIPLMTYSHNTTADIPGHCTYSFSVFLSDGLNSEESSSLSAICTVALVIVFFIMAVVFFLFDRFVRRRNVEAVKDAAQSNAIVSSLFPDKIKQRLFAEHDQKTDSSKKKSHVHTNDDTDEREIAFADFMYQSKPIADLFPETTILCADIVGFTAWSSVREPSQVFILLETLFREFDALAKKRRIFKVETIGDCYVAVTGLPEPRKDHALAMARFANDCLTRMKYLTRKLEATLGPDTGDLAIRMGLHSGPVTAGVLRGDRSRFQLFGETMNTASRMESTGLQNRIHISQHTADLLAAAGKTNWISKRRDVVQAKGLVKVQTYWLNPSSGSRPDEGSTVETASTALTENTRQTESGDDFDTGEFDGRTTRLIEWNVDVLLRLLKQMQAQRTMLGVSVSKTTTPTNKTLMHGGGRSMLDEVKDTLTLPKYEVAQYDEDLENIVLDPAVVKQMYAYVSSVASSYRNSNSFHNFEHASHVVMSMIKLLSRVVPPVADDILPSSKKSPTFADIVHSLTSDPLNQFSFILSALIVDVDHPGVTNAQLVKESSDLAVKYRHTKVTEQNAVDSAWRLLMEERFTELRGAICQSDDEMKRFRQLVVRAVLVSDVADAETKARRDMRWERAFSQSALPTASAANRQATAVIDCLVQATCVSHTMQHWHIYRKWNKKNFAECHEAHKQGRSDVNPASSWYESELAFFDDHVIPLARKLKECGVFGVSSDEYLHCATRNRNEWVAKGRDVVNEMLVM